MGKVVLLKGQRRRRRWAALIPRVKQAVKWDSSGALGLNLWLFQPDWWTWGDTDSWCGFSVKYRWDKNRGLDRLLTFVVSLYVSATMVVMMVVHVLHCDPAPHSNHKCFNLTLVVPTSDTEVAVLPPVLSPGVGSNLKKINYYTVCELQLISECIFSTGYSYIWCYWHYIYFSYLIKEVQCFKLTGKQELLIW